MKRYKVEVRIAENHLLCFKNYFETLDDAVAWVNDERFEDYKRGENDDYEYEIIDRNKQGGNEQ